MAYGDHLLRRSLVIFFDCRVTTVFVIFILLFLFLDANVVRLVELIDQILVGSLDGYVAVISSPLYLADVPVMILLELLVIGTHQLLEKNFELGSFLVNFTRA